MAYRITDTLAALEASRETPLDPTLARGLRDSRDVISGILSGSDARKLIICGPCSIHSRDSALRYAERLKTLASEVQDQVFLVMRAYFEKPRTAYAWKGFLHQPRVGEAPNLVQGLIEARALLTEIAQLGLPTGTELLSPLLSSYLEELIAWGCIGARTSESQTHRELASSLDIPVGFKNNTEGNIEVAVNGIISASRPHQLVRMIDNAPHVVISEGNPSAHLVLRGRNYPQAGANYDEDSVMSAADQLTSAGLSANLIIDCSHGNSEGDFRRQRHVADEALRHIQRGLPVSGVLIESHLRGGRVHESPDAPSDISITDPCLGWDDTERLIRIWAEALA